MEHLPASSVCSAPVPERTRAAAKAPPLRNHKTVGKHRLGTFKNKRNEGQGRCPTLTHLRSQSRGKQEQHLRGIREVAGSVRPSLRGRWEKATTKGREGRSERRGEGRAGKDAVSSKPGRQSRFKRSCGEVCIIYEIRLHREGRTRRAEKNKAVQSSSELCNTIRDP